MNANVLMEFGLTANEAAIFALLLGGGAKSATELAKDLGLNRPYIYYALERLLEKGFISEIREDAKRKFDAISPSQLISLEEHKLGTLRNLVEELEKSQKREETQVEVYKGKHVVKNLFKRLLYEMRPQQETLSIGFDEHMMEMTEPINIRKVFNYMKENRITERAIVRSGSRTLEYAKTTKYRFIPQEMVGNTAKYIYQDVVMYLIYGEPTYGIVVKNLEMADAERRQFEIFWKAADRR